MLEFVIAHLGQSLIVVGLILLAIEILILGFATFVLFYIGCGAIITGILISMGIIPSELLFASSSVALLSGLIAVVSWRPLKSLQNNVEHTKPSNDMIGHRFMLDQDIAQGQSITMKYSGIDWLVRSEKPILLGLEVEIIDISVGRMQVKVVE